MCRSRHVVSTGSWKVLAGRPAPVVARPLCRSDDYGEPAALSSPSPFWGGRRVGEGGEGVSGGGQAARRLWPRRWWGHQHRLPPEQIPPSDISKLYIDFLGSVHWHKVWLSWHRSEQKHGAAGAQHGVREPIFPRPMETSGCFFGPTGYSGNHFSAAVMQDRQLV